MRLETPEGSDTVSAIAELSVGVNGELLNLVDFANVTRTREDNPRQIIRYNGQDTFTLAVAGLETEDIVKVGHRVDIKLAELSNDIPYGVELHPIYQQHLV